MRYHHSENAPQAIGPYSQAVEVDGWLYTSGQVALDPANNEMVGDDFESQALRVFGNLAAVLEAAGCSFQDVAKATVYLTDFANFPTLNEIYAQFMGDHRPARSTVQVAALPKGALLEIDLVARPPRPA